MYESGAILTAKMYMHYQLIKQHMENLVSVIALLECACASHWRNGELHHTRK